MRLTEAIETINNKIPKDYNYTHLSEHEVNKLKWLKRTYKRNPKFVEIWLKEKQKGLFTGNKKDEC